MPSIDRKKLVQFRRSYAIIIGINKYEKINASLSTPVPDAVRLSEVLRDQQGFAEEDITLLTNPTKAEIEALLNKLKRSKAGDEAVAAGEEGFDISKRDCLLFYYAGHGLAGDIDGDGPAGYLLPSDAEPETARLRNDSLIPMEEVFSALDALDCHHTLLILDCCFAGSFRRISRTRGNLSVGFRPMSQIRFERYKKNRAWQVLASAGPTEKAADWMSDRGDAVAIVDPARESFHSPFAKALIDALSGEGETDVKPRGKNLGDGVITANELFLYLHNQVERLTREHQDFKPQNPDLFPMSKHDGGQFIFGDPRHPENDPAFDQRKKKNPYKGLHLFQPWDRDWFFGRKEDVDALLRKLDALPNAVLLLSGASGTGKSSLVRAGLLPAYLEQGYQCFVLRPGARPWSLEPLALTPTPGPDGAPVDPTPLPLADHRPSLFTGEKQILFIDQYEEFFTECTDAEQAELEAMLIDLVEKARTAGNSKIIISMRSDFEWQLELSKLGERLLAKDFLPNQFHRLAGLDLAQLREALLGPAILHAYEFEKRGEESLVDRILQDIEYAPSALPLLSFTMSELFRLTEEERRKSGEDQRVFTFHTYEDENKLGGVAGALRGKLNQVYSELPDDAHRHTMEQIMLRMVRLNDGAYSRRRLYRQRDLDELHFRDPAKNQRVEAVLRALSESQLLIQGGGRDEAPYIELIHDSLVNTRPTFEWIKTFGGDNILLQRQLWQAVVDSQRPQDQKRSLTNTYAAFPQGSLNADESLTSSFSKLWDANPKLLQVLQEVSDAARPFVLAEKDAIVKEALSHIAAEDQKDFRAFWEDCHQKQEIPDLNSLILSGYSDKLLDVFLENGDHWLNQEETAFIRQSWIKRIADILDLKRQRDEAVEARTQAEARQKEIEKLLQKMAVQNRAFKQKYQEQTRKDFHVIQAGYKPNLHLILVGINDYPKHPLTGSVNDVHAIAGAFSTQEGKLYDRVFPHLLTDAEATKKNILDRIAEVKQSAGIFDFVFLFFCGLGMAIPRETTGKDGDLLDGGFIAYSENMEQIMNKRGTNGSKLDDAFKSGILSGRELCTTLMTFSSKVILTMDTCHGGEFLSTLIEANQSDDLDRLTHNVFGLSGSSYGEKSYEIAIDGKNRGAFSYALTNSITHSDADLDGNGVLYLDELLRYTAAVVREKNPKQNVLAVVPPTMTNIPLFQLGETFALPEKEIALNGHITEDAVIESVLTLFGEGRKAEKTESPLMD